jgi:ACT domain-containing protein
MNQLGVSSKYENSMVYMHVDAYLSAERNRQWEEAKRIVREAVKKCNMSSSAFYRRVRSVRGS